jgi:hypothetical protein
MHTHAKNIGKKVYKDNYRSLMVDYGDKWVKYFHDFQDGKD